MFLPSFTNSITQARKKEEAEKEREKRKESPHDYPRLFHLSSSRRTRERLVWLRSPAQDTKDQICHLLTIHGLECNPLGETGLGWTVWWAKKRAGIGNSSARWRGELDGGGGSSWAVSNGWRRIAARPSSFCPRVLPYLRSVLSASVKTRLCRVSLHPCSFTSLSVLINPFFPLLRRFPRASLALYRNSRESFPLTDRNKNATHRSASLQRPDLLLLSSFFFSLSLSLFFHGRGNRSDARATCHSFYAGDELTSLERAGYDGRIDCFIADYVSYAFCPVILPKWSPWNCDTRLHSVCWAPRVAERTRVPRLAHDRMEIEQIWMRRISRSLSWISSTSSHSICSLSSTPFLQFITNIIYVRK